MTKVAKQGGIDRLRAVSSDGITLLADRGPQLSSIEPGGLASGTAVGRYVIAGRIGQGAMGVVYHAHDPELDRRVAIKVLHLPGVSAGSEAQARGRLLREAQAMAKMSHPNVVNVHDVGTFGDEVFLAMELVEGITLADWLLQAPRSWREILEAFMAAGHGLAAAHRAGVIHRDFKPQNVLFGRDGRVRVADFGLARAPSDARSPADVDATAATARRPSGPLRSSLTATGMIMGTPFYMSPEQHLGQTADEGSDQFSFAVALYEALYGRHPFTDGQTLSDLALATVRGVLRAPPRGRTIPNRLTGPIARALRTKPQERHPSMGDFLSALSKASQSPWRRAAPVAVTILAAMAVVVAPIAARQQARSRQAACVAASATLRQSWTEVASAVSSQSRLAPLLAVLRERFERIATERSRTCLAGDLSEVTRDRSVACLDERAREQADVLALSRSVSGRATESIADHLGDVGSCARAVVATALLPSQTPDQERAAQRLRRTIQEARNLLSVGRYHEALAAASRALGEARTDDRGDPTLPLEAMRVVGEALTETGELRAAEGMLRELYGAAERLKMNEPAADAAARLIAVVGYLQERWEEGRGWADEAERIARAGASVGTDVRLRLRSNRAALLAALALKQQARGDDQAAKASLSTSAADLLAVVDERRREDGVRSLAHADSALRACSLLARAERRDEAKGLCETALSIYGPDLPGRRARAQEVVATFLASDAAEAEALFPDVIAGYRTAYGVESLEYGNALCNQGALLGSLSREPARARELLTRGTRIVEKEARRARPEEVIGCAISSASANVDGARWSEAEEGIAVARRWLDRDPATYGEGHYYRALLEDLQGRVLVGSKRDPRRGLAVMEGARKRCADVAVCAGRFQGEITFSLADAYWQAKRRPEAVAAANAARPAFEAAGDGVGVRRVTAWLARHAMK